MERAVQQMDIAGIVDTEQVVPLADIVLPAVAYMTVDVGAALVVDSVVVDSPIVDNHYQVGMAATWVSHPFM